MDEISETNLLSICMKAKGQSTVHKNLNEAKITIFNEAIWNKIAFTYIMMGFTNYFQIELIYLTKPPIIPHTSHLTHWPLGDFNEILEK